MPQPGGGYLVGVPSPALSEDIVDASIRNRDFKDGTLRGQEAKRNGFGGGAIRETTLDASQLDADDIGKVKGRRSG